MSSFLAPILALNILNCIPWTFIFLVTQLFGVRLYYIRKHEECSRIQNRLKACSHTTDGGKGYGYSWGYWYVLHITSSDDDIVVSMIATAESYRNLTEEPKEDNKSLFEQGWKLDQCEKSSITIFERSGAYTNPWFRRRTRDTKDIPRGIQKQIVTEIIDDYMKRKHTVSYIYGNPGTGKSMIGLLIANEFSSYFCNTLKVWQPGDTLGLLLTEVEPTPQKPLIVVMDEFDLIIEKIHLGLPLHKNIPIAVHDKSGWNHMLDSIQRGMYPNIILILTSNRGPDFIELMDPSYIRKGRVDLRFEMNESLIET